MLRGSAELSRTEEVASWVACAKRTGQKSHPTLMTVADVPRMARDGLGQPRSWTVTWNEESAGDTPRTTSFPDVTLPRAPGRVK